MEYTYQPQLITDTLWFTKKSQDWLHQYEVSKEHSRIIDEVKIGIEVGIEIMEEQVSSTSPIEAHKLAIKQVYASALNTAYEKLDKCLEIDEGQDIDDISFMLTYRMFGVKLFMMCTDTQKQTLVSMLLSENNITDTGREKGITKQAVRKHMAIIHRKATKIVKELIISHDDAVEKEGFDWFSYMNDFQVHDTTEVPSHDLSNQ